MKKTIQKRLSLIVAAAMLISLALNYCLQIRDVRRSMYQASEERFWQINQILLQNEQDTEQTKKDFKENCLIRAKAAAYIIQYRPEIIHDLDEMKKVADLLQVDEFHLFDAQGNLYSGSEPKYYGMNFSSGTQMQFFLPMLEDRSLELCQDITPNTAEQKLMQYAAVWREDGKEIVQIGMEPDRVVESMKKNELSYIFSLVTSDSGSTILAVDPDTYEVLGSTDLTFVGRNLNELGITPQQASIRGKGFHATVDGVPNYCVFADSDSVILGRIRTDSSLYQNTNRDSLLLAIYLIFLSVIIIVSISGYLDRYIVRSIYKTNEKLCQITNGDLDTRVEVCASPEFAELSGQINRMVDSLLDSTNKMSAILNTVRIPIAVYEYNPGMKRVLATSRISDILNLNETETERILSDSQLFEAMLAQLRRSPVEGENEIYRLPGEPPRYIRLESVHHENSRIGIIMDVTQETEEKQQIVLERDVDILTGLYNRRAFYSKMEALFQNTEELGLGVLMMADADNLKRVNDKYGHENGDRYLKGIASLLKSCPVSHRILARLSGDEFVIFLYKASSRRELQQNIQDICTSMDTCTVELCTGTSIPVRFSEGCAFFPEDSTDISQLLKLADERMYENKKKRQELFPPS